MASDSQAEDRERVARCLTGDPAAWEEFIAHFRPLLVSAVQTALRRSRRPGSSALMEDILQEVYLALLKGDFAVLRGYDPQVPLKHLLVAVAVHRTYDRLRREPLGLSLDHPLREESLWKDLAESGPEGAPRPSEASDRIERIGKALPRLSPDEQAALKLFYWEDLPTEGIARLLDVKPGTARSLLTRARERLKTILRRGMLLL